MNHRQLEIDGNLIHVCNSEWTFETKVMEAVELNNKIIVIFDYMDFDAFPKDQPANNISAYDKQRTLLWTTEHPTGHQTSAYVGFLPSDRLRVYNFAGFACFIDENTGALLECEFTK